MVAFEPPVQQGALAFVVFHVPMPRARRLLAREGMPSLLIVDDDRELTFAMERSLADQGHDVHVAQGMDEALGVLKDTPVDVLLTDLRLGDEDGIALLRAAVNRRPGIQTVLVSAYATAKDYAAATELGAVRVLTKPFSRSELLATIQQALECRHGFRGSIHGLSLVDVLQMFHLGRRSTKVVVGGRISGAICLRDGEIVHAHAGEREGPAALQELLRHEDGYLSTTPLERTVPETIRGDFSSLIMDALRLFDEASREEGDELVFAMTSSEAPPAPLPAVSTPMAHPEPPVSLRARWSRAHAELLGPGDAVVLGIVPSRGTVEAMEGVSSLDAWADVARDLVRLAAEFEGACGVFEYVQPNMGGAVIWDRDRDFAFVLAKPLHGGSSTGWFRSRVAMVLRGLSPAASPEVAGG